MIGSGWAGTNYFLDPATGIAVVFGTQAIPPFFDLGVHLIWPQLEMLTYAGLQHEQP